jgi:hypothetical protein
MTVTIDIFGSVEKLAWSVVAQVLQFVAFVTVGNSTDHIVAIESRSFLCSMP